MFRDGEAVGLDRLRVEGGDGSALSGVVGWFMVVVVSGVVGWCRAVPVVVKFNIDWACG